MRPFDPRLLRVLPTARGAVVRLGALAVCGGLLAIGQAFAIASLVVAVVSREPFGRPATALAIVLAGKGIHSLLTEWVAAREGAAVSTGLREQLLARWLRQPADTRPEPGRALTLATAGTTAVEPYVARFLPALLASVILPAGAIATLLLIDWPSALITILTVPLLPFFAALIGQATADATATRWRTSTLLAGHFLDVVRGLPTLVSYGRARRQTGTIREVSLRHRDDSMTTLKIAFLSSAALELLATISVAIVAVTAGVRLAWGDMPLLTALTAILLSPEAYWPIRRVGAEFHNAADGAAALKDVLDQLAPEDVADTQPQTDTEGLLSLRQVCYRYPGTERMVLDHVDLDLRPGLTAVTGTSGAGKTTLLEIMAGLRTPTAGRVTAPPAHLVTQSPFVVAGTVRENLTLARSATDDELRQALGEVGLIDDLSAMPDGLDTWLGDGGFGLSAGQRARLALARALLDDSELLLLDEPTAHLDNHSAELVHRTIQQLAVQRSVVVVTHRPELVALADQEVALT